MNQEDRVSLSAGLGCKRCSMSILGSSPTRSVVLQEEFETEPQA